MAYLTSTVDVAQASATILDADILLLLLAIVQICLQPLLAVLRWKLLVRGLGGYLAFPAALRFVWIGTFFSQVLPGSVGGDVVRIWLYWERCGNRRIAIQSVLLERLVMVFVLLLFVLAIQPGLADRGVPLAIVLSAAIVLIGMIALLSGLVLARKILAAHDRWLLARALLYVAQDLRGMLINVPGIVALCVLSVAAYLNFAIVAWIIARALGLNISIADTMVLMPIVVLVATLPISLGGWGVRESAAITLFGLVGVPGPDALALSVLFGLAGVVICLPGAFLWIPWNRLPRDDFNPTLDERADRT